jgi:hypothetical protein
VRAGTRRFPYLEDQEQLDNFELAYKRGELEIVSLALDLCVRRAVHPPKWICDGVADLAERHARDRKRRGRNGNWVAQERQRRIHQVRWATVKHLKENCRERALTWDKAYEEASRVLRGTIARGSAETMSASYKRQCRDPMVMEIKSVSPSMLAESARSYFALRENWLNVG